MKIRLKILFVVSLILATILVGESFSKYKIIKQQLNLAQPSAFIFESNYEDGELYYLYSSNDTAIASIDVLNHLSELPNAYSERNITYNINVKDITNNDEDYYQNTDCTLSGGSATSNVHQVTLRKNNIYQVTIESSSPFNKIIEYTIHCVDQNKQTSYYTLKDLGDYLQVEVYIGNVKKNLEFEFGGYSPDNTNALMIDWLNGIKNEIESSKLNEYSHYTFIFFGSFNTEDVTYQELSGNQYTISFN